MSNLNRIIAVFVLLFLAALPAWGAEYEREARLHRALEGLVNRGGVAVGKNGRLLFVHGRGYYTPASITKLATALAAFHHLGPDYRFRTEFYLDGARNLIVRGYGDPYLISEEWALIARELAAALGLFEAPLRDLVLDDSAFAENLEVDGATASLNPYDARLGALVSNFNTIFVQVSPGGGVASAEPQTPLTPLSLARARALPPGRHRINFSQNAADGLQYTGELARAFLKTQGARFEGRIRRGVKPDGLQPVLIHRSSRTLREVVRGMMQFSNNTIANQIVLVMGMEKQGEPAEIRKGMALASDYLVTQLGLERGRFTLVEGSGLSRQNRIGLLDMLRIVEAFRPHRELLKFYGKGPWRAQAKTGTLTGIYTMAGFLPGGGNSPAFVIMLNQLRHTRGGIYRRISRAYGRPVP